MIYGSSQHLIGLIPLMMIAVSGAQSKLPSEIGTGITKTLMYRDEDHLNNHLVKVTLFRKEKGEVIPHDPIEARFSTISFQNCEQKGMYKIWINYENLKNEDKDQYTRNEASLDSATGFRMDTFTKSKRGECKNKNYLKVEFLAGGLRPNQDISRFIPYALANELSDYKRQTIYELTLCGTRANLANKAANNQYCIVYNNIIDMKIGTDIEEPAEDADFIAKRDAQYEQMVEDQDTEKFVPRSTVKTLVVYDLVDDSHEDDVSSSSSACIAEEPTKEASPVKDTTSPVMKELQKESAKKRVRKDIPAEEPWRLMRIKLLKEEPHAAVRDHVEQCWRYYREKKIVQTEPTTNTGTKLVTNTSQTVKTIKVGNTATKGKKKGKKPKRKPVRKAKKVYKKYKGFRNLKDPNNGDFFCFGSAMKSDAFYLWNQECPDYDDKVRATQEERRIEHLKKLKAQRRAERLARKSKST